MQCFRHLKEHFKLINLRAVLRSCDVKFDEPIDGILAGLFADAQVGRLATGRTNAAGLKAEFVETTVLRPGPSQPVIREGGLNASGEEKVTEWSFDAEAVQCLLLLLPTAIS